MLLAKGVEKGYSLPDTLVIEGPRALIESRSPGGAELLAFVCNGELFAVELRAIHEIVIPPPITPVPRACPAILGICSVRGRLATVVDLRHVLGQPPQPPGRRSRVLLAQSSSDELLGLLVDEVRQVVRLSVAQLELSSQNLGGDVSEAVRGIGRPDTGEVLVLLDLLAVLQKGGV